MNKNEKEIISAWICNEELRLSDELHELRNNLRFRRIDVTDCFDLAFSLILTRLLHLGGDYSDAE